MIVIIKLVLAHLIGDFLLQPNSFVKAKAKQKLKAWQLYVHSLVHGAIVLLLLWEWNWEGVKIALWITLAHFLIDASKVLVQTEQTRRLCFVVDQVAHFISIYFIWIWFQGRELSMMILTKEDTWLIITCVFILTTPASIAIKLFISKWTPGEKKNQGSGKKEDEDLESLKSAGKYIGMLERLFVFGFIVTSHWEAIGFLLAAKSIFRFGDLKDSKDRKLTEYILLGTLVSFGIAILTGFVFLQLLK